MTTIQLRPYQREAADAVFAAWRSGIKRPGLAMATGAGKTICFAKVIEESNERALVIAHRRELIDQAVQKLSYIIDPHDVGVVMANRNQATYPVVVASIQTLANPRRLAQLGSFGLVVYDECFPAGTPIDGSPIESLAPGDTVRAYDHGTNAVVSARVLRTSRRIPTSLVRVWSNGEPALVCTPDHPVFAIDARIGAGTYVAASDLTTWHVLTEDTDAQMAEQTSNSGGRAVHPMRDDSDGVRVQTPDVRADWAGLLLGSVPGCLCGEVELGTNGTHQSTVRLGAHDRTKSDEEPGEPGEDVRHAQGNRASTGGAVWQREWANKAATSDGRSVGVGNGSLDPDRLSVRTEWVPQHLQGGCGKPGAEDCGGTGRRFARTSVEAGRGPEEGCVPGFAWVDRVEVLEPGSDGRFGGLCPDGHVYNLEVEKHHNYFANGYLVHNCHHSASPTAITALHALGVGPGLPTRALGVTATWDRGDGIGLDEIWEQIVYQVDIESLIASGHLCDIAALTIETHLDMAGVGVSHGDYDMGEVERRIVASDYADTLAHAVREHAADRTSLVFAPNVATAGVYRDALRQVGIRAELVSARTPRDDRARIVRQFGEGRIQAVVNVGIFTEGTDIPRVDAVVMGRPTRSRALYQQMAGRGLRPFPGKQNCRVIDLVGITADHKLQQAASLIGREPKPGTKRIESFADWIAQPDLHDAPGFATVEVKGALGQTFRQHAKAIDLIDRKRLAWTQVEINAFSLPAGEAGSVVIDGQPDGTYRVIRFGRDNTREEIAAGIDIGYAQGLAEQVVLDAEARQLANPQAGWRRTTATEKQLETLAKMRIPHEPGISRGDASALITARIDKINLSRMRKEARLDQPA